MDKYEVAVLAEDYHNKRERFRYMQTSNISLDAEQRRKDAIEYHVAEAEMLEALQVLERAKFK